MNKMQLINSQKAARLGRNEACWCDSEKKYKDCHLKSDENASSKALLVSGALISPFLFMSLYLFISRVADIYRNLDYLALGLSLASGAPFIFKITKPFKSRFAMTVLYLVIGWIFLLFYGLFFVCNFFGDCL